MCGIAGFAGEDKARIEKMTRRLRHRGPDGNAIYVGKGGSLGHARLAILDPRPIGDQPMWNDDGTCAIVFNGEVYNYKELRTRYNLPAKTGTDTEVILRLYEEFGMDFVKELRGMFAFGIFDARDRSWHLARDPSGIKPLYVAYPDGRIHFASEMRALIGALPKKPALNGASLSRYLRLQYVPGPETLCEGIESVPPGTVITWQPDEPEHREIVAAQAEATPYKDPRDFCARFPALMDDAVNDHLVSDKPVGVFLSGGMDSSIVLHHMTRHTREPVKTFTVRFEVKGDEGEEKFNTDANLAALSARHYTTDHCEVLFTAEDCRKSYRDVARALDQPNADTVAPAQFFLAKFAKEQVDVVLTGSGGDELFGGYPRYRVVRFLEAFKWMSPEMRALFGKTIGVPSDVAALDPGPLLAERLLARSATEIEHIARGHWFLPAATGELFEARYTSLTGPDPIRNLMECDRSLWLVDESLRLMDGTTMASGLEARVPFLDPRIIAAALGTPSTWHVGWRTTKALIKKAYYPLLPPHLQGLKKAGFFPPFAKWLRRECGPLIDEALENKHIKELFDIDALRGVAERHRNHEAYSLHVLSTIIQLSFWFEEVYDATDDL